MVITFLKEDIPFLVVNVLLLVLNDDLYWDKSVQPSRPRLFWISEMERLKEYSIFVRIYHTIAAYLHWSFLAMGGAVRPYKIQNGPPK